MLLRNNSATVQGGAKLSHGHRESKEVLNISQGSVGTVGHVQGVMKV